MKNNMIITLKQQKIISNPIRSQIIMLLFDEAMTSKQVATKLDKTPGNIHYHIQKLYEHGIIELEREEKNKGIIEKYYRSKAISFSTEDNSQQETNIQSQYASTLTLSDDELEQFGKILNFNFNILLSGVFVKSLGSGMYSVGAMMLVLYISGDPFYSGVAFFVVSLPSCFSFLIAPFANYVSYKKALIICELTKSIL